MYQLSQTYPLPQADPAWRELVFFDIETTGFHRVHHRIGLISLAYLRDDQIELVQYFAETPEEEPLILTLALQRMQSFLAFVSYNGDRFDIPFLNARAKHHTMGVQLPLERSLDLYRIKRRGTLKQTEAESGYDRRDRMSGEDWARRYVEYTKQPRQEVRDELLLHNRDDVRSLFQLVLTSPAHRSFIDERVIRSTPPKLMGQVHHGQGNLRVLLHRPQAAVEVVDLALFDTPNFSVLAVEDFAERDASGKQALVLIEYGQPIRHRIRDVLAKR